MAPATEVEIEVQRNRGENPVALLQLLDPPLDPMLRIKQGSEQLATTGPNFCNTKVVSNFFTNKVFILINQE